MRSRTGAWYISELRSSVFLRMPRVLGCTPDWKCPNMHQVNLGVEGCCYPHVNVHKWAFGTRRCSILRHLRCVTSAGGRGRDERRDPAVGLTAATTFGHDQPGRRGARARQQHEYPWADAAAGRSDGADLLGRRSSDRTLPGRCDDGRPFRSGRRTWASTRSSASSQAADMAGGGGSLDRPPSGRRYGYRAP
jgi:hypothetical protein